ncbi:hypothetical protein [Rhizobium sp. CNPSo 4039]|uniref:hypothetical protein n=1 Tax=Rhizobium sp. CNPSo 4039 TaxID=3021409 RepID=UPI00254B4650|nr:hypothetical protein [Rhizobium sp. CNPSo 4039]MDK4715933.1 hypothetical protein [Rhizobium sp. CNPSo 4039]
MKNTEMDAPVPQIDVWNIRSIAVAGLLGVTCAAYIRVFDFWPVGSNDELRGSLDLFGFPVFLMLVAGMLFFWVIRAFVDLFYRRFRGALSSFVAIAIVPASLMAIVSAPIFDPWLWYVVCNKSSFESTAAVNGSVQNGQRVALIEERDITTGIAGVTTNHFVALIYSEGDPADLESPNSVVTHIYGSFYRRDEFQ